jgi:hypothetical protein
MVIMLIPQNLKLSDDVTWYSKSIIVTTRQAAHAPITCRRLRARSMTAKAPRIIKKMIVSTLAPDLLLED